MPGGELERLIEEYHSAIKKYSEAVSRLKSLSGTEFDRAYRQVDTLREASERCRAVLEKFKQDR